MKSGRTIPHFGEFSRTSQSAMSKSPDHPPPASIPGIIVFCVRLMQPCLVFRRDGLPVDFGSERDQSPIECHTNVSHTVSCHRPSCRAHCASSNNFSIAQSQHGSSKPRWTIVVAVPSFTRQLHLRYLITWKRLRSCCAIASCLNLLT